MAEDERFRLRDILGQFGLDLGSIRPVNLSDEKMEIWG